MTVNGATPSLHLARLAERLAPAGVAGAASRPEAAAARPGAAAVRPPAGADPTLWSVLTPEEQAFFAQQAMLGPLTYGPRRHAGGAELPLGSRIDARA